MRPAGADAHRPEVGRQRDRDVLPEPREVAVGEVEDLQVRVGEVLGQQPEAGQHAGPAPALGRELQDLDGQHAADAHVPHQVGTHSRSHRFGPARTLPWVNHVELRKVSKVGEKHEARCDVVQRGASCPQ